MSILDDAFEESPAAETPLLGEHDRARTWGGADTCPWRPTQPDGAVSALSSWRP
jgi:hypothetical protein